VTRDGCKLHRRISRCRQHMFVFVTNRVCAVPATNNVSDQRLRPSVIFRKVTNGFRCEWGAETYGAIRSVVETAKANAASALQVLKTVLLAGNPTVPRTGPG
jgi:transposase